MGDELFSLEAQDLEIKESIIDNRYSKDAFYGLGAKNNMIINDSVLGNKRINLVIATPNLEMNYDTIEANNLNIVDVKNLISDEDTTIKAQEKININALALKQINVEAPKIVINGKEYNQRFVRKNPTNEIEQKRIELLDLLSKIKDKYITKYDEILKKKKDTLYNMSLVRKR